MIQTVECANCKTYSFPANSPTHQINLEFTSAMKSCECCNHNSVNKWQYSFCDLKCFSQWLNENDVLEKGFPCRACLSCMNDDEEPTGWAYGIESNGTCKICDGTKRIKGTYCYE